MRIIHSEPRCKICGKTRGNHKAGTLNCPTGRKSRIGYIAFSQFEFFVPKKRSQST